MTAATEKFVVYWLGYHQNPPPIQSLPTGIDVVNLFLLNLATSSGGTTLDYNYITSQGTTWDEILTQSHAAQANGVKVCVSIIPPNNSLIWNTIPDSNYLPSHGTPWDQIFTQSHGARANGVKVCVSIRPPKN